MKTMMILLSAWIVIGFACTNGESQTGTTPLPDEDMAFLDDLQYHTFQYFVNEINPENGLVKDRSTADSPSSIAAVGFAFPVWAIGAERGWISKERARQLTLNSMRYFWNSPQGTEPLATGYKGFYYHFIDMKNGQRVWNCELSTIDTAWLLAGVRFASQYYSGSSEQDSEIRALADSLTFRVDWSFFTRPDTMNHPGSVTMSWRPERGWSPVGWVGYNEALYLYILAAGSGYQDAASGYEQWLSHYEWKEPYPELGHAAFPPLFGHQYSHIFVDFRDIQDRYMRDKGIDYFENSRRALLAQRRYAIDNPMQWAGYDSLVWGLTACDGPGIQHSDDVRQFRGYSARGATGPADIEFDDGTIAPTAVGASVPFAPALTVATLREIKRRYGSKGLWGPYGLRDAFNPTLNWIDSDYLGIDQGPIVLMIENFRTGMIWEYCMRDPVIRKGLQVLDFQPVK